MRYDPESQLPAISARYLKADANRTSAIKKLRKIPIQGLFERQSHEEMKDTDPNLLCASRMRNVL